MNSDKIIRTVTKITDEILEFDQMMSEESDIIKDSVAKLKKTKKDTEVTFNHWKQGKVTGKYKGLGKMGGRTFAKVCTDKATHWVPVHHINESQETQFKLRREHGTLTPNGNKINGEWVLRNKKGEYVDSHTYRNDLFNKYGKHNITVSEEVFGEEAKDPYSVKKNRSKEDHWDVFHNGSPIGHIKKGQSAARKKGAIRRGGTGKMVTTWEAHLDHDKRKESSGWVGRYTTYGHPTKSYAMDEIKRWHKISESTNEEVKGWKHAGHDISKWRAEKGKNVKLVALKKDGNESKMHDATTTYTSLDYARRHHDNKVKLNPNLKIRHNVYVDGKLHDTWN